MVYYSIHRQEDVADHLDWLHPSERRVYDAFRFEKRKNDWLTGRWTAKNLVKNTWFKDKELEEIEIRAGENRAPFIYINNVRSSYNITISHSHGMAFCATSIENVAIGCDMEKIEVRSPHFISDYFTEDEINSIKNNAAFNEEALITIYWSAKESVMKVLRKGMKIHPCRLEVSKLFTTIANEYQIALIHTDTENEYYGWGKVKGEFEYVLMCNRQLEKFQKI